MMFTAEGAEIGDGSPGAGFLIILILIVWVCVLVPLSLGITAEMMERRLQGRRFQLGKALWRTLYAFLSVYLLISFLILKSPHESWWRAAPFIAAACLAGYFALRLRRQGVAL